MSKPKRKREPETVAEILARWRTPLRSYGPAKPAPRTAESKRTNNTEKESKS